MSPDDSTPNAAETVVPIDRPLVPVVAELHAAAFPDDPWSQSALTSILESAGCYGFLARVKGLPAGYAMARLLVDEAEIVSIGVLPQHRRRGLGAALLDAALERARQAGAHRMHLEVAEDNVSARAFYDAGGFEAVGRRAGYYRSSTGNPVDALLLARKLDT